jgi:transposase InsO family protein
MLYTATLVLASFRLPPNANKASSYGFSRQGANAFSNWFNNRIHKSLNDMTPVEFRKSTL